MSITTVELKSSTDSIEEVKKGEFTSKYALADIVELKLQQPGSPMFVAQVRAIIFSLDEVAPIYLCRRTDGVMLNLAESEICIRGVDYEIE